MLLLLYMAENEKVLDCFGDENCVMPKKLPACLTVTMKQASGICRRFECQETTPEDFAVIRYLGEDEFQWYSSTFAGGKGENDWDSYTVLERTTWLPGWLLAPEFQRVQYVFKQPEGSRPWICTIEELPYGLMLWGFKHYETAPRGRGGKKVTGVFVAHYYSDGTRWDVRSKLRRSDYLCEPYCTIVYNLT